MLAFVSKWDISDTDTSLSVSLTESAVKKWCTEYTGLLEFVVY